MNKFATRIGLWLVVHLLSGIVATADAQSVQLLGWEGRAKLLSSPGASIEQFRLRAETSWGSNVSREPSLYRVRIDGPSGRSLSQQFSENDASSGRWTTAFVPADWVRNRLPEQVGVSLTLVEARTGKALSNTIRAGIDEFPHPTGSTLVPDPGPFGWGEPVPLQDRPATPLTRSSPEGLSFVLIQDKQGGPPLLVSKTEVSIAQVKRHLRDYDPTQGRSDEFSIESPAQPAIGMSPERWFTYLKVISATDPCGLTYRLPSIEEWKRAALAGSTSKFWWGNQPNHPQGANLIGAEPGLADDSTARVSGTGYQPNAWGLFHTIGNVEEWASAGKDRYARLGGHFRSEIETELPQQITDNPGQIGADPYVGARPVASLDGSALNATAQKRLGTDPRTREVKAEFDLARLTLVLTGKVAQPADRRVADALVEPLWVVACVENRIETPRFAAGQLAEIGQVAGPARRITPLGRWFDEIPVALRWAEPLPVSGSDWWVNLYLPSGDHYAHRLADEPSTSGRFIVLVDLAKVKATDQEISIALSLGAEAPRRDDPRIVSNVATIRPR